MTEEDSVQSKSRLALTSQVDSLVVFRLESGQGTETKVSTSLDVTAAVSAVEYPRWNFSVSNITITIFASLVIFFTLAGNTLVIVAVIKERRLRKVSNSFVINLAVSDVLVGVLVTPMALLYQLHGHWVFSSDVCDFWVFMDVICCTASIANLCAISYDRYNAITEPLRYARRRTLRRAFYLIFLVWAYSVCIALPPFVGWGMKEKGHDARQCKISQNAGYTLYSTIGAFYLPTCFMLFAYICIYRETSKRTKQWRCGPGSSKMISERGYRQESISIPMTPLVTEKEPSSSPCHAGLSPGTGDSRRRSSGSGAFLRNSSMALRYVVHYDSAIAEEDESRKERSSSSSCGSTNNATPSIFQITSQVDAAYKTTMVSAIQLHKRPAHRTYGSFTHKLIRQISNLPSCDSSTATSSSSVVTTSSSELFPDHYPAKCRMTSPLVRKNAIMLSGDGKDSVKHAQNKTEQRVKRRYPESPRKSVTFRTPPAQDNQKKKLIPITDSNRVVGQMARCVRTNRLTQKRRSIYVSQDKRAAKTLSVVLGCFILCWLPFFLVALLKPLCRACDIHPAISGVVLWLGYCNSALNPIIYTFFNKDFRFAFINILCCACRRRRRRRRQVLL